MTQTRREANNATSSVKVIAARLPSSTAPKTRPATNALDEPVAAELDGADVGDEGESKDEELPGRVR